MTWPRTSIILYVQYCRRWCPLCNQFDKISCYVLYMGNDFMFTFTYPIELKDWVIELYPTLYMLNVLLIYTSQHCNETRTCNTKYGIWKWHVTFVKFTCDIWETYIWTDCATWHNKIINNENSICHVNIIFSCAFDYFSNDYDCKLMVDWRKDKTYLNANIYIYKTNIPVLTGYIRLPVKVIALKRDQVMNIAYSILKYDIIKKCDIRWRYSPSSSMTKYHILCWMANR